MFFREWFFRKKMSDFPIGVYQTSLAKGLPLPSRAHLSDAGYDLQAAISFTIGPGESKRVPTGLVFDIPVEEYVIAGMPFRMAILIEPRTSLGEVGLLTAAKIIDSGYRSKPEEEAGLELILRNAGKKELSFDRGKSIAQALFQLVAVPRLVVVKQRQVTWKTDRSNKRFGDTGR